MEIVYVLIREMVKMLMGFSGGASGKEPPVNAGDVKRCLGQEGPLEEGMMTYSSIFVCRITWTEEPGWSIVHSVAQSRTRVKRLSTHV